VMCWMIQSCVKFNTLRGICRKCWLLMNDRYGLWSWYLGRCVHGVPFPFACS
jgi:hypothetical protein